MYFEQMHQEIKKNTTTLLILSAPYDSFKELNSFLDGIQ